MKKGICLLLAAVLALAAAGPAAAENVLDIMTQYGVESRTESQAESEVFVSGDLKYTLDGDGAATVIRYTGEAKKVTVPGKLDGHPVKAIGPEAFAYNTSITAVSLPKGLVSIGDNAFGACLVLKSVTLPDSLVSIGDSAFYGCISLTGVTIPENVTEIGKNPWASCDKLASIKVSKKNTVFTVDNNALLRKTDQCLICYPAGIRSGTFAIPEGTAGIADNAFAYCENLRSVSIPDSVTEVGDNPWRGCPNMASLDLSGNHPTLSYADGGLVSKPDQRLVCYLPACEAGSFEIPDGILTVGAGAFYECPKLTRVVFSDSIRSIRESAFSGCSSLDSVVLPAGITTLEPHTFYMCRSLTGITLPDSLVSVGEFAFALCFGLETVFIPDGVTAINDAAFARCRSLKTVRIPDSVTFIGQFVFTQCKNLTVIAGEGSYAEQYCMDNNIPHALP